jgi:hypothetical protein
MLNTYEMTLSGGLVARPYWAWIRWRNRAGIASHLAADATAPSAAENSRHCLAGRRARLPKNSARLRHFGPQ